MNNIITFFPKIVPKMARLKQLRFDDYDEMMDYYNDNEEQIHLYTLDKLEKSWKKKKIPKTVDIYKVDVIGEDDLKFMSILDKEWSECFEEMKCFFVNKEMYEAAARVRNFEKIVFNIED